jgi:hypothetical protein
MKKFYLLFTAMLALFVTTAKADRILFSENYEAGGVPATWTRNGSATTLTIVGDTEGKYISQVTTKRLIALNKLFIFIWSCYADFVQSQ